MYIKTAEIVVNKKTLFNIVEKWKQIEGFDKSNELLDRAKLLNFTLRVPFKAKGGESHMHIASRLEIIEGLRLNKIMVQCNVIKPITISLVILFFGTLLLWIFNFDLAIAFLIPIALSVIFSVSTFSSIDKRSEEFLTQLKQKYLIQ